MSIIKSIVIPAAMLCVVGLTGCSTIGNGLKVSDKDENSENFCGSTVVFSTKITELQKANAVALQEKRALAESEVWSILKSDVKPEVRAAAKEETGNDCRIDPAHSIHNVQVLDRNSARTYVFGAVTMNSVAEAEEMSAKMDNVTVKFFSFVSTRIYASLKLPLNVKYTNKGYNMKLVLVFRNGGLVSAFNEGSADVSSSTSQLLVNPYDIVTRAVKGNN